MNVWFREDIRRILIGIERAVAMAPVDRNTDTCAYLQGFRAALLAVALAFGMEVQR